MQTSLDIIKLYTVFLFITRNVGCDESYSCKPKWPQVLVYNRVGKAGSSLMLEVLKRLSRTNNFTLVMPKPFFHQQVLIKSIRSWVKGGKGRALIANHFYFPDILDREKIQYFNIARHPVSLCTSYYYYLRYGPRPKNRKVKIIKKIGTEDINTCIANAKMRPNCLVCRDGVLSSYFKTCNSTCKKPDGISIEPALQNVKHYSMIGLTERLGDSVKLLEQVFPSFFHGASPMVQKIGRRKVTSGMRKYILPNKASLDFLRDYLKGDIQFYKHLDERFEEQFLKCNP